MPRSHRWILVVTALLTVLAVAPVQAGKAPVALALDVIGVAEPALEPFAELFAGDSFTLGDDAEVTFLHYVSCQEIVVRGGHVNFSDQQYTVRKGKVVDVKRAKCPKTVSLGSDTRIGGVVLRAAGKKALKLTPQPSFVVVGAKRDQYVKVRILKDGKALYEGALAEHHFQWPADTPPLAKGKGYALELLPAAGGKAKNVGFEVGKPRGKAAVTLVRVD